MAQLQIFIDVADSAQTIIDKLKLRNTDDAFSIQRIADYVRGLTTGKGVLAIAGIGGTNATSTITFSGAPVAAETCSINGTTFTARATNTGVNNEFQIGGSVSITAANLAAAVNASTSATIKGIVRATSSSGVVTLTSVLSGVLGNSLAATTEGFTNGSTSGAFAGGAAVSDAYRLSVGRV